MLIRGDNPLYDREFRNVLHESGFHIVDHLVPLYHMASYLSKYEGLSQEAKRRLKPSANPEGQSGERAIQQNDTR